MIETLIIVQGKQIKAVYVTTQDFINFWGKFFISVLLEMIGIS
jgi:hypothetical protein